MRKICVGPCKQRRFFASTLSIAACAVLRDRGYEVDEFIRQLDQLRTVSEMVFPNARDFIRPGLDWLHEML